MKVKAEECPLLLHWDSGLSTWSWSFQWSVSLLAEAYLEVEGGQYHTAVAGVIKPQPTPTEHERVWEHKTRLVKQVWGFRQWPEVGERAEKLQKRGKIKKRKEKHTGNSMKMRKPWVSWKRWQSWKVSRGSAGGGVEKKGQVLAGSQHSFLNLEMYGLRYYIIIKNLMFL